MNRRQRIIVSITGITLVLLILLGLTYGYFLTRIEGNTKDKSIDVTAADLLLVYKDGDGNIIEQKNITPGAELGSKTFSVENQGDTETEYVVVIDKVNITNKKDGQSTSFESNDFVYKLTCTSNNESNCNGQGEDTTLPLINEGILVGNKIAANEKQTYTLTVTYKKTEYDQSKDMGKQIEAKIDIKNFKDLNPFEEGTLAYKIIKNAATVAAGTELKMTPETEPLKQVSNKDEKELTIAPDDYGTSYYYRGNVEDNYVQFADMCWRIVRIQGDGSVKLILASEKACSRNNLTTYSGFATEEQSSQKYLEIASSYGNTYEYDNGEHYYMDWGAVYSARPQLISWLNRKITDQNKLKEEKWCIGDLKNAYYYVGVTGGIAGFVDDYKGERKKFEYIAGNRYYRTETPKLKCETTGKDGEIDTNKIGMLTMDEVAFAGGGKNADNSNYYLIKEASYRHWWTLSSAISDWGGDVVFRVNKTGRIGYDRVRYQQALRPVITLVSGTKASGKIGTRGAPYVITD